MLLEISGEITLGRKKGWSQSKNNTQLWMWLMMEVKSNIVKNNIAQGQGMLGAWIKVNWKWSNRRWIAQMDSLQWGRPGSIPGLGRSTRERKVYPLQWECPGAFPGLYSPCSRKESDITEWLSLSGVNINILGISELKWTWADKSNSDDHYIYYYGQESLRRNGVALMVNKRVRNAVLGCNLKNDRMISEIGRAHVWTPVT